MRRAGTGFRACNPWRRVALMTRAPRARPRRGALLDIATDSTVPGLRIRRSRRRLSYRVHRSASRPRAANELSDKCLTVDGRRHSVRDSGSHGPGLQRAALETIQPTPEPHPSLRPWTSSGGCMIRALRKLFILLTLLVGT